MATPRTTSAHTRDGSSLAGMGSTSPRPAINDTLRRALSISTKVSHQLLALELCPRNRALQTAGAVCTNEHLAPEVLALIVAILVGPARHQPVDLADQAPRHDRHDRHGLLGGHLVPHGRLRHHDPGTDEGAWPRRPSGPDRRHRWPAAHRPDVRIPRHQGFPDGRPAGRRKRKPRTGRRSDRPPRAADPDWARQPRRS